MNKINESYAVSEELGAKLNSILADEFLAAMFYRLCIVAMKGRKQHQLEELAEENGKDELEDHAYWLLERLDQLNKQPETIKNIDELNKHVITETIEEDINLPLIN